MKKEHFLIKSVPKHVTKKFRERARKKKVKDPSYTQAKLLEDLLVDKSSSQK